MTTTLNKIASEIGGLITRPHRVAPLAGFVTRDGWRTLVEQRHLYRFAAEGRDSLEVLHGLMEWVRRAQRPGGGIAAYYSLLTGYAPAYPETTGYLIPTAYDYAEVAGSAAHRRLAEEMTEWLLGLQLADGAFPGGFATDPPAPSVFNSGQILHGLVRAWRETGDERVLDAAVRCGDWLVRVQHDDGRWEGPTYKGSSHTYYTMVSWPLALLAKATEEPRYARAAERHLDWVVAQQRPSAWFDGIGLPVMFLHFIAYLIQGALETGRLVGHQPAIDAATKAAWRLLRSFEIRKWLNGDYRPDWKAGGRYACLTGNAQMSCVWLRLHDMTGDMRWLNAAMKMNELVKETIPQHGPEGTIGGVAGSFPLWGRYQPMRYINWGAKFFADALLEEQRAMRRTAVLQ